MARRAQASSPSIRKVHSPHRTSRSAWNKQGGDLEPCIVSVDVDERIENGVKRARAKLFVEALGDALRSILAASIAAKNSGRASLPM